MNEGIRVIMSGHRYSMEQWVRLCTHQLHMMEEMRISNDECVITMARIPVAAGVVLVVQGGDENRSRMWYQRVADWIKDEIGKEIFPHGVYFPERQAIVGFFPERWLCGNST